MGALVDKWEGTISALPIDNLVDIIELINTHVHLLCRSLCPGHPRIQLGLDLLVLLFQTLNRSLRLGKLPVQFLGNRGVEPVTNNG